MAHKSSNKHVRAELHRSRNADEKCQKCYLVIPQITFVNCLLTALVYFSSKISSPLAEISSKKSQFDKSTRLLSNLSRASKDGF